MLKQIGTWENAIELYIFHQRDLIYVHEERALSFNITLLYIIFNNIK